MNRPFYIIVALSLALIPASLASSSAIDHPDWAAIADSTYPGAGSHDSTSGFEVQPLASLPDLGAVLDPVPVPADSQWWDGFKRPGLSRGVKALTLYEGDLIAAGAMHEADSIRVKQLARWDGEKWWAFSGGLTDIHTIAVYEDKVVAGRQGTCGGYLVEWWDGSRWLPLGHGLETGDFEGCWEFPEWVNALAEYDGYLYAGGWFYKYMHNPKANLLRWDGVNWTSLGSTVNHGVDAFTQYDGKLIVGGSFTQADGISAYRIAAWDGSIWSSLGNGMNDDVEDVTSNKVVKALAVYNQDLYAGGKFNRADSTQADKLARWDENGWSSTGFDAGGQVDGSDPLVNALALYDGRLIVGGNFRKSDGAQADFIASYNGETWSEMGSGLNGEVLALQVREGLLVAGGTFYASGTDIMYNVAIWDGEAWHPMGAGQGLRGFVYDMTVYDDHLVAGGDFNVAGDIFADRVASWDGGAWDTLGAGWGTAGENVKLLTVFDGDLLGVGDIETGIIKRWNGSAWEPYAPDFGSQVRAITAYKDRLVAAGDQIATLDGGYWTALGGPMEGHINTLAVLGGALVAGGKFSDINGVPAKHVAMWDGSEWTAMGEGFNFGFPKYGVVNKLFVYEGELIAGGYFNRTGSEPLKNIAKWTGETWVSVGNGITRDNYPQIYDMAVYNGTLIAAGDFRRAGSLPAWNIARWNGSAWSPMGSGIGIYERYCSGSPCRYTVYALEVYDGSLYAGGYFKYAGGKTAFYIARWRDAFPGMVMHFEAIPSGTNIHLRWTNPDTTVHVGTLIRYSTIGFPQNPTDGLPVPNGADGRFTGDPGSDGSFFHNAVEGETYYYAAFAYDNSLTYSTPAFASATAWDSVPPGALTYFEASEDTCRIRLAWTTPSDADVQGVLIRYSNDGFPEDPADGEPLPNGNEGMFECLPDSAMVFTHDNLDCDTTYHYSAWAYDPGFNYSEVSHARARSADPPAAVSLQAMSIHSSDEGIVIQWTNPAAETFSSALIRFSAEGYPAHRQDGYPVPNGNGGVFEGDPGGDTCFVHNGLGTGITYYYSAWAQYQREVHSVPVQRSVARTDTMGISPPSDFEVVSLIEGVHLSWTNPDDERFSHTMVRYSDASYPASFEDGLPVPNGNGGIFEGEPGSDTTFLHTALPPGGYYYYSAWAFDINSNYSAAVNGFGIGPTDTLAIFHVIPNDGRCYLTWTVPSDRGIDHVMIRFSTEGFPLTVEHGEGLPNGHEGKFDVGDVNWDSFWHEDLQNGVTYYYSAFAHFVDATWYSAPLMRSATPLGPGPQSPVLALFNAVCGDGSVVVSWTPPDEATVDSVVVRYSTTGFPAGPNDGEPLPNGSDGWFAAVQGVPDEFTHTGLSNGLIYYYSGFTHFRDPSRFSLAVNRSCAPEEPIDQEPPDLSVSVLQNPYLTQYLDVYLVSSEKLLPALVSVHVAGQPVMMDLIDEARHVWRGDYKLEGPAASVEVGACASDTMLNRACETVSFAAGYLTTLRGGEVSSPDGLVRLLARPGGMARDTYVLVVSLGENDLEAEPAESGRQLCTYRLSPDDAPSDRGLTLEFSYAEFNAGPGVSPDKFYIEQTGGERLTSYVDLDRQRIVTTVRSLGTFKLVVGEAGASVVLDPKFLTVGSPRPNPFSRETRVWFEVRARQNIRAVVYDARGRVVSVLLDADVDPGVIDLSWNGSSGKGEVPSGIYFLEIRTECRSASRKLLLLK